jgi:hypothetical protein
MPFALAFSIAVPYWFLLRKILFLGVDSFRQTSLGCCPHPFVESFLADLSVFQKLPKLFELDKDGQVDYLKSLCGISDDDAKYILSLSFSQLTKSDQTGGRRSAENFRKQIATNERLLRNPATAVAKAL